MNTNRLAYIGIDNTFHDKIKSFFDDIEDFELLYFNSSNADFATDLINTIYQNPINAIIFDFSNLTDDSEEKAEYQRLLFFLKINNLLKTKLTIAVVKSKQEIEEQRYFISLGINYFYIKSDILDNSFCQDIGNIGLSNNQSTQEYAKAKNIELAYIIMAPSHLSKINADYLTIEHNVDLPATDKVEVKFNLFEDFNASIFEVFDNVPMSEILRHKNQSVLAIPYSDSWDKIEDNSLFKDTVETWLESSHEHFIDNIFQFQAITSKNIFTQVYKNILKENAIINVNNIANLEIDQIKLKRPSVILVEFDDPDEKTTDEDQIDSKFLGGLITVIKKADFYVPTIIVFNCPSSSEAMRKAYDYSALMAYKHSINFKLVKELIDMFIQKNKNNIGEQLFTKYHDQITFCELKIPVEMISFTEHEVTFFSEHVIPIYTVIKIDAPCDLYLLTIPIGESPPVKLKHHFCRTIIHGVEEIDLELIRRFVNHVIFTPLTEFSYNDTDFYDENGIPLNKAEQKAHALAQIEENENQEEKKED